MYCGAHFGGQHGFGQHGLGSQQRGRGGHGSQHGSRSQQQLVKERAKAAIKPKPKNFFIQILLFSLRIQLLLVAFTYYPSRSTTVHVLVGYCVVDE